MSHASLTKLLSAVAVALALGQGALAQTTPVSPQSAAKLGSPSIAPVTGVPAPDPGSLFSYSGSIGTTLRFLVTGATRGGIWGSDTYTSDSVLAVAAVHAGLLEPGQSGIVTLEMVRGLPTYPGVERNGVTSLAYGAWEVAYRLTGVDLIDGDTVLPDPGDLSAYRGQNGLVLKFEVTGSTEGSLWGDGIYTDDSSLAAVAVHAGALTPGEKGIVTVEILPAGDSYTGSLAHGLTSSSYGPWQGSYRVLPPLGSKVSSKLSN